MADERTPAPLPWWYAVAESFVVRVGFPAAVATYVLVRLDSSLGELRAAIATLTIAVNACLK